MPLHFLDFFSVDHQHGHHDDLVHLHAHGYVHSAHKPSAAAFLSSFDAPTCSRPSRLVGDSVSAAAKSVYTIGAARLTAQHASAFLGNTVPGTAVNLNHHTATSLLSLQKRLSDVVMSTPPTALVPLHAASVVFALPGHIAFELGEGYLFGFRKGLVLALMGKSLGSAAAFIAGRSAMTCGCLKERITDQMANSPLCKKIAQGVEKGGAISVFVVRMAPVPSVVKNYSFALLTNIPFSTFVLASVAGLVPTTAAHVYAGTLAPSAVALASGQISGLRTIAIASPMVAGIFLTVFSGYYLTQYVIDDSEDAVDAAEESDNVGIISLQVLDKL